MPRFYHGEEPYDRELPSVWEADRTASGAVLIPREVILAIFGRAGAVQIGDGTERDMYPQTDLKVNLGTSVKRFNDGYIGGALYLWLGTGTDTCRAGGTHYASTKGWVNVAGSGDTQLAANTLVEDSMNTDGDSVSIVGCGTFAANANNKRLRLQFGAVTIFDSTLAAMNGGDWIITATVMRSSATTIEAEARCMSTNGTLGNTCTVTGAGAVADLTANDTTIQFVGNGVGASDVTQNLYRVIWAPDE